MRNVIIVDTINRLIVRRILKHLPKRDRPIVFSPGEETLLKGCKFNNVYFVDVPTNHYELLTTVILPCMVDSPGSVYYRPDDLTIEEWLSGVSSDKRGY